MLVHRRVTPNIKFAGTHLYIWVERGTVRVKCLAQEHNTMSPARARTRTAQSGDERTNHEATAPPTSESTWCKTSVDQIMDEMLFWCAYEYQITIKTTRNNSNDKVSTCEQQFKFKHSGIPLIRTPRGHAKSSVCIKRVLRHKVKDTCFIDERSKADIFTATKCLNCT